MNEEQAARLRAALEYVTERPREWVQDFYAVRTPCGTMACLAGRIVLQAGYELSNWATVSWFDGDSATYVPIPGTEKAWTVALDGSDDYDPLAGYPFRTRISTVAAELTGLGWLEADSLFAASNSLRTLWERAAEFSGGLIEVPADLPEWADLSVVDVYRSWSEGIASHVTAYLDEVERGVR